MGENDAEVRELRERVARLEAERVHSQSAQKQRRKGGCLPFALAAGVVALAAFLGYAWNVGRVAAQRDDAIASACRAAGESEVEVSGCIERMDRTYRGDLTPQRTANAAALHIDTIRREAD